MLLLAEDKGRRRKGGIHVRREQERRKGRSFYVRVGALSLKERADFYHGVDMNKNEGWVILKEEYVNSEY